MALTYSVLAKLSQHIKPTDKNWSTCAANISEGKMVLTYSVLAAHLSQHIKRTDRHGSTCAANISEGKIVLSHSVRTTHSKNF